MLTDNNGILSSATEARAASIIGEYKERVAMTQMALKTDITSKMVTEPGYIATGGTDGANFVDLANKAAKEMGLTGATEGGSATSISKEGYTVAYYYDTPTDGSTNGEGYIVIWYTSNSFRSSVDMDTVASQYSLVQTAGADNQNKNQAVLASVIKVENYGSSLSNYALTSTTDADSDIVKAKYGEDTTNSTETTLSASELITF